MAYRIEFLASADREFDSLPQKVQGRVRRALDALSRDPRRPGSRKLRGSGLRLHRVRVGSYRVIYQILDQTVTVVVVRVGHRRDVYRGF